MISMKRIFVSSILLALFLWGCGDGDVMKEQKVEAQEEIAENTIEGAILTLKTVGKKRLGLIYWKKRRCTSLKVRMGKRSTLSISIQRMKKKRH